jgi:hypothetical protein
MQNAKRNESDPIQNAKRKHPIGCFRCVLRMPGKTKCKTQAHGWWDLWATRSLYMLSFDVAAEMGREPSRWGFID